MAPKRAQYDGRDEPPVLRRSLRVSSQTASRFESGLLNAHGMSDDLRKTVERNAADSPFLRLPGELRKRIWSYVMQDLKVHIELPFIRPAGGAVIFYQNGVDTKKHDERSTRFAFQLPRVCRQIYSDTALLLYSLAIFSFENNGRGKNRPTVWSIWASGLSPAQQAAVKTVEVENCDAWGYYGFNFSTLFHGLERLQIRDGIAKDAQQQTFIGMKEMQGEDIDIVVTNWNSCAELERSGFKVLRSV